MRFVLLHALGASPHVLAVVKQVMLGHTEAAEVPCDDVALGLKRQHSKQAVLEFNG